MASANFFNVFYNILSLPYHASTTLTSSHHLAILELFPSHSLSPEMLSSSLFTWLCCLFFIIHISPQRWHNLNTQSKVALFTPIICHHLIMCDRLNYWSQLFICPEPLSFHSFLFGQSIHLCPLTFGSFI